MISLATPTCHFKKVVSVYHIQLLQVLRDSSDSLTLDIGQDPIIIFKIQGNKVPPSAYILCKNKLLSVDSTFLSRKVCSLCIPSKGDKTKLSRFYSPSKKCSVSHRQSAT